MFRRNDNEASDRLLLKRCNAGDPLAQESFRTLSYQSRIARTISQVNHNYSLVISGNECEALRTLVTLEIYAAYDTLPHPRKTLHERIQSYVFAATVKYINER